MTPPDHAPQTGWRRRATALSSRVPTKWFATGVVAVFLVGSAAFGGLNDAPPDDLPQVALGSDYRGAELSIAVSKVVLIDSFPEQYITPPAGRRLLVVVATVTNVWNRPVTTYKSIGAADNVRPVGVPGIDAGTPPGDVLAVSDGTVSPRLQPNVPLELAYVWEVDSDAVADGASVRVELYDKVYSASGFVTYGERYDEPFAAAYTDARVTDVGAGAGS